MHILSDCHWPWDSGHIVELKDMHIHSCTMGSFGRSINWMTSMLDHQTFDPYLVLASPIMCMRDIFSYCVPKNKTYVDPFGFAEPCLHLTKLAVTGNKPRQILVKWFTPTSTSRDLSKKRNGWDSNPNFKWKHDLKYSIPDWQPIDCILAAWPLPKTKMLSP